MISVYRCIAQMRTICTALVIILCSCNMDQVGSRNGTEVIIGSDAPTTFGSMSTTDVDLADTAAARAHYLAGLRAYELDSAWEGFRILKNTAAAVRSWDHPDTALLLQIYNKLSTVTGRQALNDSGKPFAMMMDPLIHRMPDALDAFTRSQIHRKLAVYLMAQQEQDDARYHADLAMTNAIISGDSTSQGKARWVASHVYLELGEESRAIPLLEDMLAAGLKQEQSGGVHEAAYTTVLSTMGQLARCYLSTGLTEAARAMERRSVAHALRYADRRQSEIGNSYRGLAVSYAHGEPIWDSVEHYIELAAAEYGRTHPGDETFTAELVNPVRWLARANTRDCVYWSARGISEMEAAMESMVPSKGTSWDEAEDPIGLYNAHDHYAWAYESIFRRCGSQEAWTKAMALRERISSGLFSLYKGIDPSSGRRLAEGLSRHGSLSLLMYAQQLDTTLWSWEHIAQVFEEQKSAQLKRSMQAASILNPTTRSAYSSLRSQMARRSMYRPESANGNMSDLVTLNRSIDSLQSMLFSGRLQRLPEPQGILSRAEGSLGTSTLLLNYSWGDTTAFLLALAPGHRHFQRLPRHKVSDQDLDSLITLLARDTPKARIAELTNRVKRLLIPDIIAHLPFDRIVVIADGPLYALPFEPLLSFRADTNGSISSEATIRYELCMSMMAEDLSVDTGSERFCVIAPDFSSAAGDHKSIPSNGTVRFDRELFRVGAAPLTANIHEAESVHALFQSEAFIGADAKDETEIVNSLVNSNAAHFATHAVCSETTPEESVIFLSDDYQRISGESFAINDTTLVNSDNLLHAYEIQSLNIPAELIVISACESASGIYRPGEGAMSLARAFKYAGAKSIVSSLWKVDDLATKEIMVKFYEHLAEGMGKADALAEAKRWYRNEYPNEPPSKWAAFILIGDNEPVRLKKRSPVRPWMWVSGGLVLLLAGTMVWRRTRRAAA